MICEFIKGIAKAQPRVKAYSRGGKAGVYTPSTADEWRRTVQAGLARHAGKSIKDAIHVDLQFYLKRPKSHFRTGKFSHILRDDAPTHHLTRVDVDNLAKLPLDVLTKMKYFCDDSQVVCLRVTKEYADIFDAGMKITTTVLWYFTLY